MHVDECILCMMPCYCCYSCCSLLAHHPFPSLGMHVCQHKTTGGEEGARNGPSLMPGGPKEAYDLIEPIITKAAAQVQLQDVVGTLCCSVLWFRKREDRRAPPFGLRPATCASLPACYALCHLTSRHPAPNQLQQVNDGPCTTYVGPIGAGNYVKMVSTHLPILINKYLPT